MKYNLTENQKELLRWIVGEIRSGKLPESFTIIWVLAGAVIHQNRAGYKPAELSNILIPGHLDALASSSLLHVDRSMDGDREEGRRCTLTGESYIAVDTNFSEDSPALPISTFAQSHPPEIAMSIDRFRAKYPDPKKVGFLIMRFTAAKPFQKIIDAIKRTGEKHGLSIIRADENDFHADLWGNVRTYLHGCGFGIAVYERIETEEPNANVGLEVGYLMAMNKPVLLLKDKTVATIQADLAGKLYKPFDPHDAEGTIPGQLTKWLEDNGIIVPSAAKEK